MRSVARGTIVGQFRAGCAIWNTSGITSLSGLVKVSVLGTSQAVSGISFTSCTADITFLANIIVVKESGGNARGTIGSDTLASLAIQVTISSTGAGGNVEVFTCWA